MKWNITIAICLLLSLGTARAQDFDDDPEERQKVSVGVLMGMNASNIAVSMPDNEFDARAGLAAELSLFTEYHINKTWGVRLVVAPSVERMGWSTGTGSWCTISTGTLDVALPLAFRMPVGQNWCFVGLGPYSRFVVGGAMSDGSQLPYMLQVGLDTLTGEPRYAVDKFGSGFAALLGYETARGLMLQVDVRMGLTNILNTETYRGRMLPYKVVASVGWRF